MQLLQQLDDGFWFHGQAFKGRHDSGNKGNFERGQNKTKACSYILEDTECNTLFVTMDTSCTLYFKRDNILQLRISLVDYQLSCAPLISYLDIEASVPKYSMSFVTDVNIAFILSESVLAVQS